MTPDEFRAIKTGDRLRARGFPNVMRVVRVQGAHIPNLGYRRVFAVPEEAIPFPGTRGSAASHYPKGTRFIMIELGERHSLEKV